MEIVQELKRVLEVNLNYMDLREENPTEMSTDSGNRRPLPLVRREIEKVKNYQSYILPLTLILTSIVSVVAVLSFLEVAWLPWNNLGIVVLLLIPAALYAFNLNNRLERLKKKELFLMMLYKIDNNLN
jgi:hypothetical protein